MGDGQVARVHVEHVFKNMKQTEVETSPVRLEINADVQDVKLVFPFCPKAKRE